ncbi:protein of unknown function DUF86 [Alkalidesulfovibrio alkalitolerans DSM 16529]|jgi:uncharacterized protein with HEPN domain|uniref:DUF86 domain-containing protein n=1 Tax=Alkalidesulfovibrio alkalitolerans DSM 16529 TaxID=1121439 RepID=S7T795_9BACT|nr:DUF86 domain-containing protein [Alkalidesulfovibrio alkalitolerans]EPR32350.1 protein of unknown function DUF86 [Alkalidesulfovibrio alkalitolerans DSM 16529]
MIRDRHVHLQDILDSIDAIADYTNGISHADFLADAKTQDAVLRRIEIIGEATGRLMHDGHAESHPEIPWARMKAMRNLIIHDYDSVDLELVWNLVEKRLPELRAQIVSLFEDD